MEHICLQYGILTNCVPRFNFVDNDGCRGSCGLEYGSIYLIVHDIRSLYARYTYRLDKFLIGVVLLDLG